MLAVKGSLWVTRPAMVHYATPRSKMLAMGDELFGMVLAGKIKSEPNQTTRWPMRPKRTVRSSRARRLARPCWFLNARSISGKTMHTHALDGHKEHADGYLIGRGHAWFAFAMTIALMLFDYIDRQVIVSLFPYMKAGRRRNISRRSLQGAGHAVRPADRHGDELPVGRRLVQGRDQSRLARYPAYRRRAPRCAHHVAQIINLRLAAGAPRCRRCRADDCGFDARGAPSQIQHSLRAFDGRRDRDLRRFGRARAFCSAPQLSGARERRPPSPCSASRRSRRSR